MTPNIWEFLDERDEWHYWWTGFAAGWSLGLVTGLFLLGRLVLRYE